MCIRDRHDEVQLMFAGLKDKLTHCFDKSTNEHSGTDMLVGLLRSFVLFRHHIVTILGSEALYCEYYRKLDDELIARRQRGDPLFTAPEFQSMFERNVFNRVSALADELHILHLRHNVYLLDCFESDISFTIYDFNGVPILVNVEVDGVYHEKKRKKTFCQLRDKELTTRGIHVVRITTRDTFEIDAILRMTSEYVCASSQG